MAKDEPGSGHRPTSNPKQPLRPGDYPNKPEGQPYEPENPADRAEPGDKSEPRNPNQPGRPHESG